MKSIFIAGLILLLLNEKSTGQVAIPGSAKGAKYLTQKSIFEQVSASEEAKYLTVTKKDDSLYFRTKDNILLASIAYSEVIQPDSVLKESDMTFKKIVSYKGKQYLSSVTAKNKNGIVENISISIDDNEIFSLERSKSFHCTNHGSTVHTCPTAPGIANPPCNQDCVWEAD